MNQPSEPAHAEGPPPGVRERRQADRRAGPTKPWQRLFGPMRRARGRRVSDRDGYVDVYTRRDVVLLLSVFLLNVGDAWMTMLWLSRGGREANPVMDFFLDISPGAFIIQKCFVVGFWLLLLVVHKNFRFARIGLYASLAVYALLMILHFGIIALGIEPVPTKPHPALESSSPRAFPTDDTPTRRVRFDAQNALHVEPRSAADSDEFAAEPRARRATPESVRPSKITE